MKVATLGLATPMAPFGQWCSFEAPWRCFVRCFSQVGICWGKDDKDENEMGIIESH